MYYFFFIKYACCVTTAACLTAVGNSVADQGPHTQNFLTYVDLSAKSSTFRNCYTRKKIEFDLRSP